MKKFLLYIIALMVLSCSAFAVAPVLKTVSAYSPTVFGGEYYYTASQTPQFTVTTNATANFRAVCDSDNTFANCNYTVVTGCVGYTTNSSGTSKTVSYIPETEHTSYTVYCQACGVDGCDKTTISGNNYVNFKIQAFSTTELVIFRIVLLCVIFFGIFVAMGFNDNFRNMPNRWKILTTIVFCLIIARFINFIFYV